MPKIDLPGGHSAIVALRMAEFRQLWASGAVQKLKAFQNEGGDLGELYPLLALSVKSWDCTDEAGNALDPAKIAAYDELEPAVFMRLMTEVAQLVGGMAPKN